jgi:hypothetical protein
MWVAPSRTTLSAEWGTRSAEWSEPSWSSAFQTSRTQSHCSSWTGMCKWLEIKGGVKASPSQSHPVAPLFGNEERRRQKEEKPLWKSDGARQNANEIRVRASWRRLLRAKWVAPSPSQSNHFCRSGFASGWKSSEVSNRVALSRTGSHHFFLSGLSGGLGYETIL